MPATRKRGERDTPRCPETAPSAPRELYGNARMSEQRAPIAEASTELVRRPGGRGGGNGTSPTPASPERNDP